ncbi:hypothetical protein N0V90_003401 [Kalmusia sp. IMI 367209]|nr:hypothetical protein N0V90_003401 [Kalmusia sp. IMI 367209]
MLGLHADIEFLILDHIYEIKDLKALCLTSKSCHERVIPRFYRHVNIQLWNRTALLFYQQYHAGTRGYLEHTRTLVIEHQEISNPLNGYAPEDDDKPDEDAIKEAEDLRMVTFMAILQLFPRDVLRDFRSIESLSITADLYQPSSEEVHQYLWAATDWLHLGSSDNVTPQLKALCLCGFDMELPWLPALRKFVNFERLVRLQITKCYAASKFFADLGADAEIKELRLKHLAVDSLNQGWGETEDLPIDKSMELVLRKCRKLESLHVGWYEHWSEEREENLIQTILDHIYRDGKSLRILGVHPHNNTDDEENVDSLGVNLERICRACPNLQQLGYQLAFGALDDLNRESDKSLDEFVHNIAQLRDLRTLHLRFPHELQSSGCDPYSYDREEIESYLNDVAESLRLIASEIFLKLDKFSAETKLQHRLDTIVIGHFTTLRQPTSKCSLPQHCFVKSETMGESDESPSERSSHTGLNDRVFRANPISRSMLRRSRSHLEILEIDIGVEPFEQWAGRVL